MTSRGIEGQISQSLGIEIEFQLSICIISYCEKDTLAVAQILLRLRGEALLDNKEIAYI